MVFTSFHNVDLGCLFVSFALSSIMLCIESNTQLTNGYAQITFRMTLNLHCPVVILRPVPSTCLWVKDKKNIQLIILLECEKAGEKPFVICPLTTTCYLLSFRWECGGA